MVLQIRKTTIYVGIEQTYRLDIWWESDGSEIFIRVMKLIVVISRTTLSSS
jgi:hypothetical protein